MATAINGFLIHLWIAGDGDDNVEQRKNWILPAVQLLADKQEETGEKDMKKIFDDNETEFRTAMMDAGAPKHEVETVVTLMGSSFVEE